ncbi:pif5 [Choristoneura murinana nucleopolyhedrovirus]|uniref:Pif5 n=1 Tax=Choristoneura murinana nucleopolyhedrovirus TaxID=1987479 RepID=V9XTE5_9ABAC|nr:pif5 [Choristoneura murinana nucleopolyhedrovirus]AHD25495.1 pif5 [Choristoneura murinana nucleopolyhedrovirus]
MSTFFTNLRRVNKVYPNQASFVTDNTRLLTTTPAGFTNVLSAPSTRNLGNGRFEPGYNLSNNQFVSAGDINRITRGNDVPRIRNVFQGISDPQIGSLNQLRRADNVPDAGLHVKRTRSDAVKQNFPETNVRSADGVDRALQQNPRLNTYLQGVKTAGVGVLLAGGAYLTFSAATLVQDIIQALNNTGGSYYVRGADGGETADACLLLSRTCQRDPNMNTSDVVICDNDPLISDTAQLQAICSGFNYQQEQTVCRQSDPAADPDSPQFVDISDLLPGQTIMCIEPYNLGDLIGDLGLDHLLGEDGLVGKSSNSSDSLSNKLMPLIWLIGAVLFLGLIVYLIYRFIIKGGGAGAPGAAAGAPPIIVMSPPSTQQTYNSTKQI